jgi:hypothetical protein
MYGIDPSENARGKRLLIGAENLDYGKLCTQRQRNPAEKCGGVFDSGDFNFDD